MELAFVSAYMAGANGFVETESDIPSHGRNFINDEVDLMASSADKIAKRASNGNDMKATALKLTSTIMRVYWFAALHHGIEDEKLVWFYGATEHCSHCQTLSGQVHTRSDWQDFFNTSGLFPRSANLECSGLYCQCGLYPTDEPEKGNFV